MPSKKKSTRSRKVAVKPVDANSISERVSLPEILMHLTVFYFQRKSGSDNSVTFSCATPPLIQSIDDGEVRYLEFRSHSNEVVKIPLDNVAYWTVE